MSPAQALERSYASLRKILRAGSLAPGTRLEASRLANELGVSMTPVRDALHQLAGERMVEASIGEGFRVPRVSEAGLRALYEWNAAILTMAVRTTPPGSLAFAIRGFDGAPDPAEQAATLFDRVASTVPNAELANAIHAASDQIHPFRIIEAKLLDPMPDELARLATVGHTQPLEIRRYHVRRMRIAAELVLERERGDMSKRL